ncbi:prenyltransferase/squalene oxidase repeat-containing protein [Streptomyces sp. NPDC048172]|uniref:prenyltransferase/squalene oxidase repeat-containing protein n=1 Tax=Streptomyces sp. NPDC048172 TaxID=3365505 RepID=UPI003711B2F1
MFPRPRQRHRFSVAVAASLALCAVTAAVAPVAVADEKLPPELYGKGDPKFDGVWRQSVALLALDAAGAKPSPKAVSWLSTQQCEDGSFPAYRADPKAKCDAKKTPADVNATAIAVQALSASIGGPNAGTDKALDWLKSVQNKDGGWGYNPGSPSDANSVSVVVGALVAAGKDPAAWKKDGKTAFDALLSFQIDKDTKDAKKDAYGAFAYQPGKGDKLDPNDDATAAAVLAGMRQGLALSGDKEGHGASPKKEAEKGADYLTATLKKNDGHLVAVTPGAKDKGKGKGQPDYANTADAVIALSAAGRKDEAKKSLDWLGDNLGKWDKAKDDPAALGILILANRATTNGDPAQLGGTDLLKRLTATGPKPAAMPSHEKKGEEDKKEDKKDDDGGSLPTWSFIVVGVAAGAGIGIWLSGRRKKQSL